MGMPSRCEVELGERGLVALAVAVRSRQHLHRARRVDAHLSRLPQADAGPQRADRRARSDAAGLDVGGEAETSLLAILGARRLACAEALVVRQLQRLVEAGAIVAGIVGHDDGRGVREAPDEVLAAELGRVLAGLARGHLDQPLHDEGRLRAARTAIGVDGRGVGVDAVDLAIYGADVVLTRQQRGVEIGRNGRGERGEISAEVGLGLGSQRQDLAARVERQLGRRHVVAAVRVREKRFRPIGHPFHGTSDLLGGPQAHRLFRVDEDLGAEAAADVRGDHAQLVLGRDADEGRQHQPRHMRVLAGGPKREALLAGVVVADGGARLDGVGDQPVVDEVDPRDVLGGREGGIDLGLVAEVPLVDGVVGRLGVDLRLTGILRGRHVDGGRQHLVVDGDLLGRVLGLRQRLGDDDCNVIADVAHLALGQRGMRTRLHGRAVLGVDHPAADQAADLVLGDVLAGEDGETAGRGQRGARVDLLEGCVRVRRAHEIGPGLAGAIDVVGVLPLAGDEPLVFLALYGRPHAGVGHGVPPVVSCSTLVFVLSALGLVPRVEGRVKRAGRGSTSSPRSSREYYSAAWRMAPMLAAPAFTAATMLW